MSEELKEALEEALPEPKRKWLWIAIITAVFIATAAIFVFSAMLLYERMYQDKVYPGVYVNGYHLGSLKKEDVKNLLESYNNRLTKEGVNFSFANGDGKIVKFKVNVLSADDEANELVRVDSDKISADAINVGRVGGFWSQLFSPWYYRWINNTHLSAPVAIDEKKRNPLDFALWKAAKEGEPSWDSPWGKGRPGWHIECSTMSTKYLGDTFDIHGGGLDLVFPHHENEIAQAEAATGKPFARYWIHNGFVTINREKMSKSLKNFFTIKEILQKFSPQVVRLFLLSTHYRSPVNYSDEDIKAIANKYFTLQEGVDLISAFINADVAPKDKGDHSAEILKFKEKFLGAMDSDFNTADAIGTIFDLLHFAFGLINKRADKKYLSDIRALAQEMFRVLGLDIKETAVPDNIKKLAFERDLAKNAKDFKKSDDIRDKIKQEGYILKDTPFGVIISRQ